MDSQVQQQRGKRYEAIHNWLFVVEPVYTLALLVAFLLPSASEMLAGAVREIAPNPWISTALFAMAVTVATKVFFLPLNYYGGYYLEHKFGLSNEKFGGWVFDELKSLGL